MNTECEYTYECLCQICGKQFALKNKFAPHVCTYCTANTVPLDHEIKAAIDTLEQGIPFLTETTDFERAAWKVCNEVLRLNCKLWAANQSAPAEPANDKSSNPAADNLNR